MIAATLFYSLVGVLPVLLYLLIRYLGATKPLVQLISICGYSLAVWLPVCALCTTHSEAMRWIATMAGCVVQVAFLCRNVGSNVVWEEDDSRAVEYLLTQKAGYVLLACLGCVGVGASLTVKFVIFR